MGKEICSSCNCFFYLTQIICKYRIDNVDLQTLPVMKLIRSVQLSIKNLTSGEYLIVVRNEFSDKLTRRLVVY